MIAVMISAIPAVADTGARGPLPNHATVDVHLIYQNGSDADGLHVVLKRYDAVPPFGSATFEGRGNYSFIANSNRWGPMQLFAQNVNDTLCWFQELYVEPKGRYQIEGVIAPYLPPMNRIYGVVRNASSGSPIFNATIEAYYIDDSLYESSNSNTTGIDGSYEIWVRDSKHHVYLKIAAEGYIGDDRIFYITEEKASYEVDFDMSPYIVGRTVPVNVRIINSTTGDHMMADWFGLSGISSLFGHYRTSFATWDFEPSTGIRH
jgi:hypothetical protein